MLGWFAVLCMSVLDGVRGNWRKYALMVGLVSFLVVLLIAMFGWAMFMNVTPSSVASVEQVDGERGVYNVTVAVPDSSSTSVVVEGDVERRVIGSGEGESFRVSLGEGEEFRIVEHYNPDVPVLEEYFSNEFVLFDSAENK